MKILIAIVMVDNLTNKSRYWLVNGTKWWWSCDILIKFVSTQKCMLFSVVIFKYRGGGSRHGHDPMVVGFTTT